MSIFPGYANYREFWAKKRKLELDPLARLKAGSHSGTTQVPPIDLPHLNLVTDPMLDWGKALEHFAANQTDTKPVEGPQVQAPALNPHRPAFQQTIIEPFRDPMSTVPGGFGSMGPGK